MTIRLSIRKGKLLGILKPKKINPGKSEKHIIADALGNKIERFVGRNDRVGIVIHDNTRVSGLNVYLPVILEQLRKLGIPKKNIVIFVATGSHRGFQISDLGFQILDFRVIVNNAFKKSEFFYAGRTRRGTPVWINKRLRKVDKVIATSGVLYHYFAGYGGGPKILMPGLAAFESIAANHKLTLTKDGKFNPKCRNGNIKDNPVYLDIVESIRFFLPTLYLGTILNDEGKIVKAFCGDIVKAHRTAAKFLDRIYKVRIKKKADVVICSAGGYPMDINLIQSHKSIHNAFAAVKNGGRLICFAECADGIGSRTFLRFFDYSKLSELKRNILKNYSLNGQTALSFWEKLLRADIKLISATKENQVKRLVQRGLEIIPAQKAVSDYLPTLRPFTYYLIPSANSLMIS
jgi:nickel-dependent lactate racemase